MLKTPATPGMVTRSGRQLAPLPCRSHNHLNFAHGAAVDGLRAHEPEASFGIIHNYQPCLAASDAPQDCTAAREFDAYWNGAFQGPQLLAHYPLLVADLIAPYQEPGDLARICRPTDWFGLNHYSPLYVQAFDGNPLGSDSARLRPRCRAPR